MDVRIELNGDKTDRTDVQITHTNVWHKPLETEAEGKQRIVSMWEQSVWSVLEKVFGYGRDKLEED